ncbi:unnamed protein product [Scytosiphon promiscuus]
MSHRFAPEALDLTLQDLRRNDKPFGGATVLFGGDWRQVGPVVLFGTPADVVESALISSYLWKQIQRFRLVQSMRFIPAITLPDTSVVIPLQYSIPDDTTAHLQASSRLQTFTVQGVTDFQHLIDFVYPDLFTADSSSFADRGILAPTNTSTDEMNAHIINLLQNTLYSL